MKDEITNEAKEKRNQKKTQKTKFFLFGTDLRNRSQVRHHAKVSKTKQNKSKRKWSIVEMNHKMRCMMKTN